MKLSNLIGPGDIVLGLRAADKMQALAKITQRACVGLPVDGITTLAALTAREGLGSTGLGRGFALPHVRVAGLTALSGLLVRLARPVEYAAIDGRPVDILFLLLIPHEADGEHLAALAAVSRCMREEANLAAIRRAGSPAVVHALLSAGG